MASLPSLVSSQRALAILVGACGLVPLNTALAQTTFTDVTAAAGIDALHSSNEESYQSSGTAAGDFDNDGWQDLFVQNGILFPNDLYLNNADGTFTESAKAWGVDETFAGHGSAVGDYDGDGWLDVYVQNWGPVPFTAGQHRLYHNDGGTGFTDRAAFAGVTTTAPFINDGYGAAFGDMDLDGDLDLFAGGWKLGSGANHLFKNNGDGTFSNVTTTAIDVDLSPSQAFAPEFVDMNKDRYPELLIVSDFNSSHYLANDGDGTFSDVTSTGWNEYEYGMGLAVGDFDRNGWLDFYVTSIQFTNPLMPGVGNLLYLSDGPSEGSHRYSEVSEAWNASDLGWSWGAVALDMDHDSWLDLVVNNGWHRNEEFTDERIYVLHNQGGTSFHEVGLTTGPAVADDGRGLLRFDYDNDGDMDLVVSSTDAPTQLFRNDMPPGDDHHWLKVFLDNGDAPRVAPNGYQAMVRLKGAGPVQTRPIGSGGSFLSVNELSAHFGMGTRLTVPQLEVQWPDGHLTTLRDVATNQTLQIQCCGNWADRGHGLAKHGQFDTPRLAGTGNLFGNSEVAVYLDSARANSPAWMAVGFSQLNAPFKGGTLVPDVASGLVLPLLTDNKGAATLSAVWPLGLPSGLQTYFQAWVQDPDGLVGFTASNALRATAP